MERDRPAIGQGKPYTAAPLPAHAEPVPLLNSADLFRHAKSLRIEHAGQLYLLRITRENKLILTK